MTTAGTPSGKSFVFSMPQAQSYGFSGRRSRYADALSGPQKSANDIFDEAGVDTTEIMDASHPLSVKDAQNTAQKSADKSTQLQEAHDAIKSVDFMQNVSKAFKGFSQNLENSTSNIAPYGFHEEGGQQVRNVIRPMSSKMNTSGQNVSPYETMGKERVTPPVQSGKVSASTAGASPGIDTKAYLASRGTALEANAEPSQLSAQYLDLKKNPPKQESRPNF